MRYIIATHNLQTHTLAECTAMCIDLGPSLSFSPLEVDRWTDSNSFVKKLKRRDGYFYYYNKARECPDKDLAKVKLYVY